MKAAFKLTIIIVLFSTAYFIHSCGLLTAAGISSQGQPTKKVIGDLSSTTDNSSVNIDHKLWDDLLEKYVSTAGLVNYKGLIDDREGLRAYLKMLSNYQPNDEWSVQELLAYYINIYNAYTVNLVLDNYPVQSIKDIDGAWTKGIVKIGDRKISLGGIENGVLRKMNEPRIHFAINCASFSCPILLNEAYTASKINEQLDKATSVFINSSENQVSKNELYLSSIFDWYEKDFTLNNSQNLIGFLNQYVEIKISAEAIIEYKNYNWNLNEQN